MLADSPELFTARSDAVSAAVAIGPQTLAKTEFDWTIGFERVRKPNESEILARKLKFNRN